MNCDAVEIERTEEACSGTPPVPEPKGKSEVLLTAVSCEDQPSVIPEVEDCASDSVPSDVKSKNGTKRIKLPQLVSMWKYMMSPSYASPKSSRTSSIR